MWKKLIFNTGAVKAKFAGIAVFVFRLDNISTSLNVPDWYTVQVSDTTMMP